MATARVARFKWPERLEIVAELPVTKMGKLDKKALRDTAEERNDSMTGTETDTSTVPSIRPG